MVIRLNVEISNTLDSAIKKKVAGLNEKRKEGESVIFVKNYIIDLIKKDLGIKK